MISTLSVPTKAQTASLATKLLINDCWVRANRARLLRP
jgi:hypothetical protein